MRSLFRPVTGLCAGLGLSLAATAAAQPALTLPEASPEASISQMVGLTRITLEYHRPAVNARKVWGDLVPWGEVWRAGANENTTIAFSTPVTVQGKPLPEGTYGLHVLPVENGDWTVIFSRVHWAWGSFSYDPKEDAARISVPPRAAELQERLAYTFDDPTEKNVTVTLRWEKVALPFAVEVDTPAVVVESLRHELRGLPRFFWQGWNQAAAYCLRNKVNVEEALQWADRSIETNETFANLRTKAGLLELSGDAKTAGALRERSLAIATEADINTHGYQLLGQNKVDEAISAFQKNVKDYPNSWNVYDSLAEAYEKKGDKKLATENYRKALAKVRAESQKKRITETLKRLEKG